MKNLHILIANDDGIHAPGIQHLTAVIAGCNPSFRLSVVAPDRERSAIGHAITMHKPLRAEEVELVYAEGLTGLAVNGTPSDCVKLAVEAILDQTPDMVISGINRGSNLGTDVLYSGTVSAAVEGLIMGIPSIAVSLTGKGEEVDYRYAADFICNLIPLLFESGIKPSTLINVNVPYNTADINGVKVTALGSRRYCNTFEKRTDPRGMHYYWMAGELVDNDPEADDSDTKAVREGYISVTPVHFQLTDRKAIAELQSLLSKLK